MKTKTINFATEFTRYPGGRYREQGELSGEEFRDDLLVPALKGHDQVILRLDDVFGFPSSFIDEAFGVLVEKVGHALVQERLKIELNDDPISLAEIRKAIVDHAKVNAG